MSRRFQVLVAEDDQDVRELIRTRLTIAGFDVHAVRNGAEALERIRTTKPNAMVLDINMPVMDGFSVLEAHDREVSVSRYGPHRPPRRRRRAPGRQTWRERHFGRPDYPT